MTSDCSTTLTLSRSASCVAMVDLPTQPVPAMRMTSGMRSWWNRRMHLNRSTWYSAQPIFSIISNSSASISRCCTSSFWLSTSAFFSSSEIFTACSDGSLMTRRMRVIRKRDST